MKKFFLSLVFIRAFFAYEPWLNNHPGYEDDTSMSLYNNLISFTNKGEGKLKEPSSLLGNFSFSFTKLNFLGFNAIQGIDSSNQSFGFKPEGYGLSLGKRFNKAYFNYQKKTAHNKLSLTNPLTLNNGIALGALEANLKINEDFFDLFFKKAYRQNQSASLNYLYGLRLNYKSYEAEALNSWQLKQFGYAPVLGFEAIIPLGADARLSLKALEGFSFNDIKDGNNNHQNANYSFSELEALIGFFQTRHLFLEGGYYYFNENTKELDFVNQSKIRGLSNNGLKISLNYLF